MPLGNVHMLRMEGFEPGLGAMYQQALPTPRPDPDTLWAPGEALKRALDKY